MPKTVNTKIIPDTWALFDNKEYEIFNQNHFKGTDMVYMKRKRKIFEKFGFLVNVGVTHIVIAIIKKIAYFSLLVK